jgi:hypothetical protein
MTSFRQIEVNRRNACKGTGPISEEGKRRSRCNAVRHGLTAETVIGALEDAEDYKAFEAAIIADYDAQSAVERELVLRLARLLWRLRRATTMETSLFEIQANYLHELRRARRVDPASREVVYALFARADSVSFDSASRSITNGPTADLARCFLRLANLPNFARIASADMKQPSGAPDPGLPSMPWIAVNHRIDGVIFVPAPCKTCRPMRYEFRACRLSSPHENGRPRRRLHGGR